MSDSLKTAVDSGSGQRIKVDGWWATEYKNVQVHYVNYKLVRILARLTRRKAEDAYLKIDAAFGELSGKPKFVRVTRVRGNARAFTVIGRDYQGNDVTIRYSWDVSLRGEDYLKGVVESWIVMD